MTKERGSGSVMCKQKCDFHVCVWFHFHTATVFFFFLKTLSHDLSICPDMSKAVNLHTDLKKSSLTFSFVCEFY